jgi:pimeloyl-ACP methyl ester carboxylesterase
MGTNKELAALSDRLCELARTWHGPGVRHAARRLEGDSSAEAAADFDRIAFPTYIWDPSLRQPVMAAVARSQVAAELSDAYWATEAPAYDLRPRLGEIAWPTLVVVGDRDWRTPSSAARMLAAGIPGATLAELPGVGHFPHAEAPAAFAGAVTRFVALTADEGRA